MKQEVKVSIKKVRKEAAIPYYASSGAAGVDLSACLSGPVTIKSREIVPIPTGIAISLPSRDLVAFVFPRSGSAFRNGLTLINSVGVIDADYRGEIVCGLINLGNEPVTINHKDRIAQMVFMPIAVANLIEVSELDKTVRGEGGFGSTGIKAKS